MHEKTIGKLKDGTHKKFLKAQARQCSNQYSAGLSSSFFAWISYTCLKKGKITDQAGVLELSLKV